MGNEAAAPTIVVIEDEADIASAVAARLRSEGFLVEVAVDNLGDQRARDARQALCRA